MNLTRPGVVDRRTYRIACRKITALMDQGDYTRAKFGGHRGDALAPVRDPHRPETAPHPVRGGPGTTGDHRG